MPSLEPAQLLLLAAAALLAGAVNAVAGGGSLISFPALLAVGYPAITANVTNSVALTPGYFGGTLGYRRQLCGPARPRAPPRPQERHRRDFPREPAAGQLPRAFQASRPVLDLPGELPNPPPAPLGPA